MRGGEAGHPVDHVDHEVEPVHVVHHDHVERCRRGALLDVAAHMEVVVSVPPVREAVDEPRVAVVGEDHRPVLGEDGVVLAVAESVRMLTLALETHQVDHVDDPDAQPGHALTDDGCRGEHLQRRDITRRCEDDVRFLIRPLVPCPFQDAQPPRAVFDRLRHRQPVRRRLLAGNDDVDIVHRTQTVIVGRQERVGVEGQVDAHHIRLLVHHVVDESRVLVRQPVVILTPDV